MSTRKLAQNKQIESSNHASKHQPVKSVANQSAKLLTKKEMMSRNLSTSMINEIVLSDEQELAPSSN